MMHKLISQILLHDLSFKNHIVYNKYAQFYAFFKLKIWVNVFQCLYNKEEEIKFQLKFNIQVWSLTLKFVLIPEFQEYK